MTDYLIISDVPTPWREPVFERVHRELGGAVHVVYFKDREKRRLWNFTMGQHPKTILKALTLGVGGTERFFNPGIVPLLIRRRPRVALVCASIKDPTAWLAMAMCQWMGTKVALISDTWLGRDREISGLQRWARRMVYRYCGDAFVGASRQTLAMFRHYNESISDEQCFLSHLVADNVHFRSSLTGGTLERTCDVMFSGRIVAGKNPIFFAQVCAGVKERLGRCHALVIGDGDEAIKGQMRHVFERHGVTYEFAGFVPHSLLPGYYARARLLLLPTSADCWGVVINEAMLAGTPVLTTEWTAAAGELVLSGNNGHVLPLDVHTWVVAATELLTDRLQWQSFSRCAIRTVAPFNYERAAVGILDAFAFLDSGKTALGRSFAREQQAQKLEMCAR